MMMGLLGAVAAAAGVADAAGRVIDDGRGCMATHQAIGVPGPARAMRDGSTDTRSRAGPMPELDTQDRAELRKNQFAYVDRDGGEHLPIHDESHVRNAMARFNQTDFESKAAKERARRKILAAAERHDIEVSDDSAVAHPAD
jgi:hypothetical protein